MAQSSVKANLWGFDQVDKTACYTSGLRVKFFFLFWSNMTMAKGVSHKQEFFESQIFSRQNWPKAEVSTNGSKSSAREYFWEIQLS